MKSIAITGGIATGKSTATHALIANLGADNSRLFDCDAEAHNLLTKPEIIATIRGKFGDEVIDSEGNVDRQALRNKVFENDAFRLELEAILHPEILKSAQSSAASVLEAEENRPKWFIMEIPLLYEVDFSIERHLDVLIAATPTTQFKRLTETRNLDPDIARKILASQLSVEEKLSHENIVVWNEGSHQEFTQQLNLLSKTIQSEQHFHFR